MLLHIGVFHLEADSQQKTLWNGLAPKTRILCTLLLVFAIALTPNGRWVSWAVYGAWLLAIVLVSRVTLTVLLKRVAVELVFIGAVLVGTLFREGGEVLWQFGWFQITTEGLMVLGSVMLKAILSLLMLNVLTLTTSVPDLLQALVALRTPPLLVAILGSMYRYITILSDEFTSMRRAALSRNLMGGKHWQRMVIGNMMGSLFIRTYERGERIHQAMLSRGYEGLPPLLEVASGTKRDTTALSVTAIVTLVGQAVYLLPSTLIALP